MAIKIIHNNDRDNEIWIFIHPSSTIHRQALRFQLVQEIECGRCRTNMERV